MESGSQSSVKLKRDVIAIQIPAGSETTLQEGTEAVLTQSLGGSHTIAALGGLFRISSKDSDAIGMDSDSDSESDSSTGPVQEEGSLEERIWEALKGCYDPEIPVNIVDLGLIYSMELSGSHVEVKMTLTAPGCGMGPAIAEDARSKVEALEGVNSAQVEIVWEPQWNPSMISSAGKAKLGIED